MLRIVSTRAAAMRPASRLSALGAVRSHCQVPCGIFDDPARVDALKEDAATVRKAMVQINELAGGDALALNQVRTAFSRSPAVPHALPLLHSISTQGQRLQERGRAALRRAMPCSAV